MNRLLDSKHMARFVSDGYLRFDELVPPELNAEVCAEIDSGRFRNEAFLYARSGTPFADLWAEWRGMGKVCRLPEVQGIIQSLVGPHPRYDHHCVHRLAAHSGSWHWHADAILDTRKQFDIQLFYFPHDTPDEMGGTMFLPGSHLRRINENEVSGYQCFVGQHAVVCRAGTVFAAHHGLWHTPRPNRTARPRQMIKIRLNPSVRQRRLWNTEDADDPKVREILRTNHQWYGDADYRLEQVQRIKLWRFLSGDSRFDDCYWLGRLENGCGEEQVAHDPAV